MSVQENVRLDEENFAAWNDHDIDRALGLRSEDVVWQDTSVPVPMYGKAAVRPYLQSWFTTFPDIKIMVLNRVVAEDQFAGETEFTATNTGPLQMMPGMPPMPATGKQVSGKSA